MRCVLVVMVVAWASACVRPEAVQVVQIKPPDTVAHAWSVVLQTTDARDGIAYRSPSQLFALTRPVPIDANRQARFAVAIRSPHCSSYGIRRTGFFCLHQRDYAIAVWPIVVVGQALLPIDDVPDDLRVHAARLASAIDDAVNRR